MTEKLLPLGMVFPVSYGIQIDLNVVQGERSLCDHNCTSQVGGYDCPSAFTLNRDLKPSFASAAFLIHWVMLGCRALTLACKQFLSRHFDGYCAEFRIPDDVRQALKENLMNGLCEVNLFGGNPEMHPQLSIIISALKDLGLRVNLTMTGRKLVSSEVFVHRFAENPPHLLAVSADDVDPHELEQLLTMPLADLKARWKQIDPLHGQKQKCLEGLYAARLVSEQGWPCTTLFNMVLHKENLPYFRQMMQTITNHLPKALLNPYPAQDSFVHGPGSLFDAEAVHQFGELVRYFRDETLFGSPNLTKRIQYWLAMEAALENCQEHPAAASKLISGHGIWQCYQRPGACLYLQIGKGNPCQANAQNPEPGGCANCYWNSQTVSSACQVSNTYMLADHILNGMGKAAQNAVNPCPGCSMPRLWFNLVSTESGLNPGLVDVYLGLRKKYVGF